MGSGYPNRSSLPNSVAFVGLATIVRHSATNLCEGWAKKNGPHAFVLDV